MNRHLLIFAVMLFLPLHTTASEAFSGQLDHHTRGATLSLQYQHLPILITLPDGQHFNKKSHNWITFDLKSTDRNDDVAFSQGINEVFNIPLEQFAKAYDPLDVADIQLNLGELEYRLKLQAYSRPSPARGPFYVRYGLTTADNQTPAIELTKAVLAKLKNASVINIEVTNSYIDTFNSNGKRRFESDAFAHYFQAPEEAEKQRQAAATRLASETQARINAYRANQLPNEVKHIKLTSINESFIPEPEFRLTDPICYKAAYPYYTALEIQEHNDQIDQLQSANNVVDLQLNFYQSVIDNPSASPASKRRAENDIRQHQARIKEQRRKLDSNSPEDVKRLHGVIGMALAGRCLSAEAVANDVFDQCQRAARSEMHGETYCDCLKQETYHYWQKNAASDNPIPYQGRTRRAAITQASQTVCAPLKAHGT